MAANEDTDVASADQTGSPSNQNEIVVTVTVQEARGLRSLAFSELPEVADAGKKKSKAKAKAKTKTPKGKGKGSKAQEPDDAPPEPLFRAKIHYLPLPPPAEPPEAEQKKKAGKAHDKKKGHDAEEPQEAFTSVGRGLAPKITGNSQQSVEYDKREVLVEVLASTPLRLSLEQVDVDIDAKQQEEDEAQNLSGPVLGEVLQSFGLADTEIDLAPLLRGEQSIEGWFDLVENADAAAARQAQAAAKAAAAATTAADSDAANDVEEEDKESATGPQVFIQVEVSRAVLEPEEVQQGRMVELVVDGIYSLPPHWIEAAEAVAAANDKDGKKTSSKGPVPPVFKCALSLPQPLTGEMRELECAISEVARVEATADTPNMPERIAGVTIPPTVEEEEEHAWHRVQTLCKTEEQGQAYVPLHWRRRIFLSGAGYDLFQRNVTNKSNVFNMRVIGHLGDPPAVGGDKKKEKKGKDKGEFYDEGTTTLSLNQLRRPSAQTAANRLYVVSKKEEEEAKGDDTGSRPATASGKSASKPKGSNKGKEKDAPVLPPVDPFVEAGTFVTFKAVVSPAVVPAVQPVDLDQLLFDGAAAQEQKEREHKEEQRTLEAMKSKEQLQQALAAVVHAVQEDLSQKAAPADPTDSTEIVRRLKLSGQYELLRKRLTHAVVRSARCRYHVPAGTTIVPPDPSDKAQQGSVEWLQLHTAVRSDLSTDASTVLNAMVKTPAVGSAAAAAGRGPSPSPASSSSSSSYSAGAAAAAGGGIGSVVSRCRALAADMEANGGADIPLAQQQYVNALALLREAMINGEELSSEASAAWYEYGAFVCRALKDHALAEQCLLKSIAFTPSVESSLSLSCVLMAKGRYAEAEDHVRNAVEMARQGRLAGQEELFFDEALASAALCVYLYLIEEDAECAEATAQLAQLDPRITRGAGAGGSHNVPFVPVADFVCRELGLASFATTLCDAADAAAKAKTTVAATTDTSQMVVEEQEEEDEDEAGAGAGPNREEKEEEEEIHMYVTSSVLPRAIAMLMSGQVEECIEHLHSRMLDLGGHEAQTLEDALTYMVVGRAFEAQHDEDAALGALAKAKRAQALIAGSPWGDRDVLRLNYTQGRIFTHVGHGPEVASAMALLQQVGSAIPAAISAWMGVATAGCALLMGHGESLPPEERDEVMRGTQEALDCALQLFAHHPRAWALNCLLSHAQGDEERALENLERAIRLGFQVTGSRVGDEADDQDGFVLSLLREVGYAGPAASPGAFQQQQAVSLGIVPDVLDDANAMVPMDVVYASAQLNSQAIPVLTPSATGDPPEVTWEADPNKLYSLVLTNPDAPARDNPVYKEFVHWAVMNIRGSDVAGGQEVLPYAGPAPPHNSGLHRYIFLVFEQKDIDPMDITTSTIYFQGRRQKNTRTWAAKQHMGAPVAIAAFQAEWDESCDEAHSRMGLQLPAQYLSKKQQVQQQEYGATDGDGDDVEEEQQQPEQEAEEEENQT